LTTIVAIMVMVLAALLLALVTKTMAGVVTTIRFHRQIRKGLGDEALFEK
jgi:hypothetical protein